MAQTIFRIEGMNCDHCVKTVTNALKAVKGVKDVKVSLTEKRAVVTQDEGFDTQAAIDAVVEEGYQAFV